jgi:hypothetical protein
MKTHSSETSPQQIPKLCHPGLDPGSSLLKPKNMHQTPKQTAPHNYRAHLRLLSAYICVNHLTLDPVF